MHKKMHLGPHMGQYGCIFADIFAYLGNRCADIKERVLEKCVVQPAGYSCQYPEAIVSWASHRLPHTLALPTCVFDAMCTSKIGEGRVSCGGLEPHVFQNSNVGA